jgi:hypothetical protein|tara:strand:- start:1152 stop:1325 length:174 start_codon:yes stop_codon:yes gene_type:complete
MTLLEAKIILGDKVSDRLAVENGYENWVDCRDVDYELSEKILKKTTKIVKKYLEETA